MAHEIVMPRLGWSTEEGTLIEWLKKDGDPVRTGDVVCVIESDKAQVEVESFEAGVLRIPADSPAPGAKVPVGTLLGYVLAPGETLPSGGSRRAVTLLAATPAPATAGATREGAPAPRASSPVTRARQRADREPAGAPGRRRAPRGLDGPQRKRPDGAHRGARRPRGRRRPSEPRAAARRGADERERAHDGAGDPDHRRRRHRAGPCPHRPPGRGLAAGASPPSYTDCFVKLAAVALLEHPALNASLDGERLVQHRAVHVGVAVDTPRGLLACVLRDVPGKSLRALAAESAALIAQARAGTLSPDALRGGTFTVSNLGAYEIDAFTPIVNLPECAILGVGRIVARAVVVDEATGRIAARKMVALSLTFDHRVVDGAPAARFLQRVKQLVEQPALWVDR